jgi:hypothetical protein
MTVGLLMWWMAGRLRPSVDELNRMYGLDNNPLGARQCERHA